MTFRPERRLCLRAGAAGAAALALPARAAWPESRSASS
jgi:hypothetical protein